MFVADLQQRRLSFSPRRGQVDKPTHSPQLSRGTQERLRGLQRSAPSVSPPFGLSVVQQSPRVLLQQVTAEVAASPVAPMHLIMLLTSSSVGHTPTNR